ncbi:PH domain-containing protein [Spiractinospora alimapuensis]|uniref:PH domain-containing protein n=1 Tax=Spiractinospora alimapuensis TaxID=2820884 RepID=UPI001F462B28|nr:PH domain-containing protein [Spiractinospora alimapuensis]QVQ51141.1 PH domain-containing protein [Spiractinospora alimapuensis]
MRSTLAWGLGLAWMVFAAGNLVDVAVRGSGPSAHLATAALVASCGVVYVLVLRPRVTHTEDTLRIVNPLRDVWIPWKSVTQVDVTDVLRVHVGEEVHRAWALRQKSRRPKFSVFGGNNSTNSGTTETKEAPRDVDMMADTLRDYAERRAVLDQGEPGPVRLVWSPFALVALVVPLAALLVVIVLP